MSSFQPTTARNGGMKKAGLVPQCSIVSRQPMYQRVRRRSMYSKLKQPEKYRNLTLFGCNN